LPECAECSGLRGESSLAFSEYIAAKDDFAMARKDDPAFQQKREEFERSKSRLRQCHEREELHRRESHVS